MTRGSWPSTSSPAWGIPDADRRVNQYPFEFSGGMRQRAMATSCNPDVLIAHEPTTALDVTIQAQIIDVVRERCKAQFDLRRSSSITHDLGVIAEISDKKVMVMYGGRTVEYGPVDEIFYQNAHPPVHAGLELGALPRLDEDPRRRGSRPSRASSPNLITLPAGCPFTAALPVPARARARDNWPAHQRPWAPEPRRPLLGSPHKIARSAVTIRGSSCLHFREPRPP